MGTNTHEKGQDGDHGLGPQIAWVRLRAEAALVERLNAGYGFADARIPGELYLRDAPARDRLSRDSLRPRDSHLVQAMELAEAIAGANAALERSDSPLDTLAARFGLDAAERVLLAIAMAYELDSDVRDLCHALAMRRRPGLFGDVCQDIAPELLPSSALLCALHPNGALRRACLIELGREGGTSAAISSEIAISRRVLDWLLGDHRIAAPLHTAVQVYAPDHDFHVHIPEDVHADIERLTGHMRRQIEELEQAGASGPGRAPAMVLTMVLIQGPMGAGKQALAHALAAALDRPLAVLHLRELVDLMRRAGAPVLLRQALTEARLRDAVVYLPGIEVLNRGASEAGLDDSSLIAVDAIAQYEGLAVLGTTERRMPSLPVARPFHVIRLPIANLEVRQQAWARGMAAIAAMADPGEITPATASELAARYVIGPGTIGEVVADARAFARASADPIKRAGIEEAVARRLTMRLGSFGTVITRRARLEEMVLPEDVIEALEDMVAMVRERTQILERWGYARHLGLNRGVSALFSGEPGTGKTMAASVISSALGLELIRIDLSAVTSKWVGETEKHLAKIFDEAQTANAMLLFDEADSLFGKRTELKSAQDRYANLEVNYVLQRMEDFDGVSVLTTNFESAIDAAFLRRLNFRVRFPAPEVEERMELWRRLLPPHTGLCDRVDYKLLAERFVMTGGHIRNAIVRAAVVAARQGRVMEPDDLFAGAHLEYVEMGKVMPQLRR
jgi:SpoVK/Ycf46/Vps4 family AAA+-type ATPase